MYQAKVSALKCAHLLTFIKSWFCLVWLFLLWSYAFKFWLFWYGILLNVKLCSTILDFSLWSCTKCVIMLYKSLFLLCDCSIIWNYANHGFLFGVETSYGTRFLSQISNLLVKDLRENSFTIWYYCFHSYSICFVF